MMGQIYKIKDNNNVSKSKKESLKFTENAVIRCVQGGSLRKDHAFH